MAEQAKKKNNGETSRQGDFISVALSGWRGVLSPRWAASSVLKLFSSEPFPAPHFPGKVEPVTENIGGTLKITLPDEEGGRALFAKYFFEPGPFPRVLPWLHNSLARRSFRAVLMMKEQGIPGPSPAGVMERKVPGRPVESVFLSEPVAHTRGKNLELYFREKFDKERLSPEELREKRELIRLLGELFRKVHEQERIYFPDLHPHNMMVQVRPGERPRLYLLDFDEVRFRLRREDKMKNLASMCRNAVKIQNRMEKGKLSSLDRVRFVKAYLGPGKNSPQATRELCQQIIENWNLK